MLDFTGRRVLTRDNLRIRSVCRGFSRRCSPGRCRCALGQAPHPRQRYCWRSARYSSSSIRRPAPTASCPSSRRARLRWRRVPTRPASRSTGRDSSPAYPGSAGALRCRGPDSCRVSRCRASRSRDNAFFTAGSRASAPARVRSAATSSRPVEVGGDHGFASHARRTPE